MQQPQQIIKRHQFQIPNNMPFSMQNQPSVAALLSNMAKNSQVNKFLFLKSFASC